MSKVLRQYFATATWATTDQQPLLQFLPLLSKSLPVVVHYPKFTANNGPPVKLRKHELRENKTHSTLDPRSMKQTTTLKKENSQKRKKWSLDLVPKLAIYVSPAASARQPFSIPKSFSDFQFLPQLVRYFAKYLKNIFGNPSQSQSLFLTFSFHHNLQNILQTSEGNQSGWIAIIYKIFNWSIVFNEGLKTKIKFK